MSDLVTFLRARLDEDEAVARAATLSEKWWSSPGREGKREGHIRAHEDPWVALNLANGDAEHIARHDPARVLREVAAKRAVLDDIEENGYYPAAAVTDGLSTRVLDYLAAVYADHRDFQEEWRV